MALVQRSLMWFLMFYDFLIDDNEWNIRRVRYNLKISVENVLY